MGALGFRLVYHHYRVGGPPKVYVTNCGIMIRIRSPRNPTLLQAAGFRLELIGYFLCVSGRP